MICFRTVNRQTCFFDERFHGGLSGNIPHMIFAGFDDRFFGRLDDGYMWQSSSPPLNVRLYPVFDPGRKGIFENSAFSRLRAPAPVRRLARQLQIIAAARNCRCCDCVCKIIREAMQLFAKAVGPPGKNIHAYVSILHFEYEAAPSEAEH